MRVLFVLKGLSVYEPMGVLYLCSALKRAGHEVDLCITLREDVKESLSRFRPHILAYSAITGAHRPLLELNRALKKQGDFYSIFGGPHATFFPEVIEEDGVDAICMGEGEEAMVEFMDTFSSEGPNMNVRNFSLKADGEVYRNPLRPLIKDLDELPFPDRELLYRKDPYFRKSKVKTFYVSRGCPFNCSYCFNHSYFELYEGKGKRVRVRSVEKVIEEIEQVRSMSPLEFIRFNDDVFVFNPSWLERFSELYRRRIGLPFNCQIRPNQVNKDTCRLLKEAGCVSVLIGVEAGNDQLRNGLLKRGMSREEIVGACEKLKEMGFKVYTQNMLGLPQETMEMAFETVDLNIACKADYAGATLYTPFPRTVLGDYCIKEGLFDGNYDDFHINFLEHSILSFRDGSYKKREIENLHKLFGITVEWPWLRKILKPLIRLPLRRIYSPIYRLWNGYAAHKRIFPYRLSFSEGVESFIRFMGKERE